MTDKTGYTKIIIIHIEPETGVAIATCTGTLTIEDATRGVSELWKTKHWPGKLVVWDFREAQFDISSSDTQKIAKFILESQPEPPPLKIAFVTGRDVDFGMARIFEVRRQDKRTDFRVFRDYEEAINWARLVEPERT